MSLPVFAIPAVKRDHSSLPHVVTLDTPAAAVQLREQLSTLTYSAPQSANVCMSCSSWPSLAMQPPQVLGPTQV
jgi:hypothetical protein|eukprot:COSAG06_NODE_20_length_33882_cov_18.856969_8_plen_74_part_00